MPTNNRQNRQILRAGQSVRCRTIGVALNTRPFPVREQARLGERKRNRNQDETVNEHQARRKGGEHELRGARYRLIGYASIVSEVSSALLLPPAGRRLEDGIRETKTASEPSHPSRSRRKQAGTGLLRLAALTSAATASLLDMFEFMNLAIVDDGALRGDGTAMPCAKLGSRPPLFAVLSSKSVIDLVAQASNGLVHPRTPGMEPLFRLKTS